MASTNLRKVRILLVGGETLFREGLAILLSQQPELELRMHFHSAGAALIALATTRVDLVLLDIDLGTKSGIEFLVKARRNGFRGPVLALTSGMSYDQEHGLRMLGLAGVLRKTESIVSLVTRVRDVTDSKSELPLSHEALACSEGRRSLTAREAEVLRLVIEGRGNKQIADELGCSESAVKGIMQQLFHKTGVNTRSQLVRTAFESYQE
jgi:two-component system, NarL family, nitrate/nitrite response regulator NarL